MVRPQDPQRYGRFAGGLITLAGEQCGGLRRLGCSWWGDMMWELGEQYRIDIPDEIYSPSLVVFRPLLIRNIERMLQIAGDVRRLRPHCKTHKLAEVVRLQVDRGVTRQKCATLAEAEMAARAGCDDILLAYNLLGPNIFRAVTFRQTFPHIRFAATADDLSAVTALGRALSQAGTSMGLMVDINPGRDRTGLPPDDSAFALYRHIAATPGVEPAGLHVYDGHHHQRDFDARCAAVDAEWTEVDSLRRRLLDAGLPVPEIVCGGTPTFPVHARRADPAVSLSPGTCLFHDVGYGENFPDLTGFTPAALVLTRVVSRPTGQRVTFDCGTKSVASDPPMGSRVAIPAIPDARQVLHNEEHLVVETAAADAWRPGDWTLVIPRHICPTTALHQSVTVIDEGMIVDRWPVLARNRVLTI
ncbi:MAG: D-TA family PLP-dependent enzyme [Planctomycetaceae bacterium]